VGLTREAQATDPPLHGQIMRAHGVKNLVFSSSATVYGNPQYLPLDEAHPTGGCTNPYGKSKFFIEEMIRDLCRADTVRTAHPTFAPFPGPLEPRITPGTLSTRRQRLRSEKRQCSLPKVLAAGMQVPSVAPW
jgi:nucleoside-diphosphate-sugar epimerase